MATTRYALWTADRRTTRGTVYAHYRGGILTADAYLAGYSDERPPLLDWGRNASHRSVRTLASVICRMADIHSRFAKAMARRLAAMLAIAPDEWSIRRPELHGMCMALPLLDMVDSWPADAVPLMSPGQAAAPQRN